MVFFVIYFRINPHTLATEGRVVLCDYVGVVNNTSHPHVLPNGTTYNLGLSPTKTGPNYSIICFPHGENMFENAFIQAHIPCRWKLHPGYMHTFGITENYFVIVEQPLTVSVLESLKAKFFNEKLSACLKWFDDTTTLFHLVDRKTGKVCHTYESEAFFYLHIINQYEEDNCVIIDICCYKDAKMIDCMYLESIMNMQSNPNYASLFRGRPLRFVLPLSKDSIVENSQCVNGSNPLSRSFTLSGLNRRQNQPIIRHSLSQHEDITFMTTNIRSNSAANDSPDSGESIQHENLVNLINLPNCLAEAYEMPNHQIFVRPELLCDWGCETPRIYYENYSGK